MRNVLQALSAYLPYYGLASAVFGVYFLAGAVLDHRVRLPGRYVAAALAVIAAIAFMACLFFGPK